MGFSDVLEKKSNKGFGSVLGETVNEGGFGMQKIDISTVKGLEQVAKKEGLSEKATEILAKKGEKPKEIYSGGFIMDIFDTLNALQYGVTGLLKGKSFSEGVKTRQSFSDKDALGDYGLPGVIGGIAMDIAVDPLTYVPVFGVGKVALKGIKGVSKGVGEAMVKAPIVGETVGKIGNTLGRAFIYRFGQDPIYKEIAERSIKNIAVGNQNLLDIAKPLTKLDSATQVKIAELRKAGKLGVEAIEEVPVKKVGVPEIPKEQLLLAEEAKKLEIKKVAGAKYYVEGAIDKTGKPITTPFGDTLPLNLNKTITVYHRTTPENALKIEEEGLLGSHIYGDEGKVYVSTNPMGGRYIGKEKTAILKFEIDPKKFNIDESYRDGNFDLVAKADDLIGIKPLKEMGIIKELEPLAEMVKKSKNFDDFVKNFEKSGKDIFCINI